MHPMNEVKQSLVRVAILNEMGLGPVWAQRFPDVEVIESQPTQSQKLAPEMTGEPDIAPSSNSDIHYEDVVQTDSISTHEAAPEEIRANVPLISSLGWAELEATVSACQACGLCKARQNTVFGVGERAATWLFVGEGPGYHEDLHGEPFIGAAGQLLDNMLLAMGVKRGDRSYIANVVKCRAEDEAGKDRPPSADEIAACLPYLQRQIALIQPKVIVALGKTAAIALSGLELDTPVAQLRGKVHQVGGIPMVATYHPAYLLRKPLEKSKAWQDLCLAQRALDGRL